MEPSFPPRRRRLGPNLGRTPAFSSRVRRPNGPNALLACGPQEWFRLSPVLTRFVTLWSLASLFFTGLPLRAETLLVTEPYTLTGNQLIDNKLGDLVDLQAGMTGYGSLLKTGDGVLKLGGTSTFSGDVVVNGGVVVVSIFGCFFIINF